MTRESKLAIIVGFSVVLVVAALISDHFSHARQARIGNEQAFGSAKDFGAETPGLSAPIGKTSDLLINEPKMSDTVAELPNRKSGEPATKTAKQDPHEDIQMGGRKGPASGPESVKTADEVDDPKPSPVNPDGPTYRSSNEQAIASVLPVTTKPVKQYKVQDNDSLYKIAKASYGDGTLSTELADFNKSVVKSAGTIRAGDTLALPPKEVLLGTARLPDESEKKTTRPDEKTDGTRVAINKTKPSTKDDATKAQKKLDEKGTKFVTYTVRRGDHLSTIAQKLLGSARRMDEILKLNPSLDDEDAITEGVVLKLPKS